MNAKKIRFISSRAFLGLVLTSGLLACDKGGAGDATPPGGDDTPEGGDTQADARVYPDPPPPSDPRPVNFPEVQHFELPNKLQVYVVENHEVPLVDVTLAIKVGEVHDHLRASMTASLLKEGTKNKKYGNKAKIDAAIEQVGGSLNAFADTNDTVVATSVLSKDLKMALELVNAVATTPTFPEKELDKIKEQRKSQTNQEKSDGSSLGQRLLGMSLYPEGHPYARPFPTEDEIDAITVDDLKAFHQTHYAANNAFLLLAGDIDPKEAEELVRKAMGYWKPASEFPPHPLEAFDGKAYQAALPDKPQVHIVDRQSISTDLFMANLAMPRNHPDWIKMSVANRFLGGGMSSRLFRDIREEKKLTYNIGSAVVPAKGIGPFTISTQTKKVDEMLTALFSHLDRMREETPTEEEFKATRDGMALRFPLSIETADQIASKVFTQITYGLPDDYYAKYRDAVLEVQPADVPAMANKYMHEVPVIVAVGKASKIKKQIGRVDALKDAEIHEYDLDLKPLK